MKFVALALIATVSAVKLDAAPYQPEQAQYAANVHASADAQHGETMADANKKLAAQQAGVAASAASIEAYKAAHRWAYLIRAISWWLIIPYFTYLRLDNMY